MGISSKDAQEWLNTFMIKKTPQSGKLGSWIYSKEIVKSGDIIDQS